jgi:hypothetical protein
VCCEYKPVFPNLLNVIDIMLLNDKTVSYNRTGEAYSFSTSQEVSSIFSGSFTIALAIKSITRQGITGV